MYEMTDSASSMRPVAEAQKEKPTPILLEFTVCKKKINKKPQGEDCMSFCNSANQERSKVVDKN